MGIIFEIVVNSQNAKSNQDVLSSPVSKCFSGFPLKFEI